MIDALILAAAMNTSAPGCTFSHDFRASISSQQGAAAGSTWYDVRLTNEGRTCRLAPRPPVFGIPDTMIAYTSGATAKALVVKHGATVHSLLAVTNPGVFSYPGKKVGHFRRFFVDAPVYGMSSEGRNMLVRSRVKIAVALNVPKKDGEALIIGPLSPGRK